MISIYLFIQKKLTTMKTNSLKFLSLMVLLASTFILSNCGENVEKMILVTMTNNSSGEVHMWTQNENIDPSNKLQPGQSRTSYAYWTQRDGEPIVQIVPVKVYAGKNGQVLTSKTFEVNVTETSALTVSYTGTLSAQ